MTLDPQTGSICIKDSTATSSCGLLDSSSGFYKLDLSSGSTDLANMKYSFSGGTFADFMVTRKDGTTTSPILDYDSGKNAYYFKMPGDSKIYAQFFYDVNRPHFTGQS